MAVSEFWGKLLQVQTAALPSAWGTAVWLRLGWALVLAALVATLLAWWGQSRGCTDTTVRAWSRGLVAVVLLWCAVPGEASPPFWLGLAFQAPSLSLGLLGTLVLVQRCAPPGPWAQGAADVLAQMQSWAWLAVVLGWVLLLDTFAIWPVALYPLGFGVAAWVALLAVVGLPWAWRAGAWRSHAAAGGWVLVLLGFALLRLPSGNVWDAVLDPWLWGVAHLVGLKALLFCYKNRS